MKPPRNSLDKAIDRFRRGLTPDQLHQFAASSVDDVVNKIEEIQLQHGSQKKLRNLSRLSKFIEALTEIEKLVQIFLNVSEVVAFVWGPIKLVLMVASTKIDTLEFLLDTYVEVGELIPHLRQYDQLFRASPSVLEILERYFEDILRFHHNALRVFSRSGWRTFFDSAWKTFRTEFKPIVESLKRHRALLSDERLNAAVMEVQHTRSQTLAALKDSSVQADQHFEDLSRQVQEIYTQISHQIYNIKQKADENVEKERTETIRKDIWVLTQKLNPPDCDADQQIASEHRHPRSGDWILREPSFLRWSGSQSPPSTVLYIHGMPGAGKTILASKIISHLRQAADASLARCLFFYFKQRDDTKQSLSHMLRSFLIQLLAQDPTLVEASYERFCSASNAEGKTNLANLKEWTLELLKSQKECYIVLDGLDECHDDSQPAGEAKRILGWLLDEVLPESMKEQSTVRLLVTGQRDGLLDKMLSKYPIIGLDTVSAHLDDILTFTRSHASGIRERFELDDSEERELVKKVTEASNGMFLYTTVVMGNLLDQGSAAELYEELMVKFPAGLNEAYGRVAARVLDSPIRHQTKKQAASNILRWVTCTVRPLKWREIQTLFCLDPKEGSCNPKNRRVDDCKTLCGSFVDTEHGHGDIEEFEPSIHFVHDTARRYLIHSGRVDLAQENANMAIYSMRYLASFPLGSDQSREVIINTAVSGYYGLLDYTVSSWQHHIDKALSEKEHLSLTDAVNLQDALKTFLEIHKIDTPDQNAAVLDESADTMSKLTNEKHRDYIQDLESRCSSIRKIIETIQPKLLGTAEQKSFLALNGKPRFKCSKPQCRMFFEGFSSRTSRDEHINKHEMQFFCSKDSCPHRALGFSSRPGLERHVMASHAPELDLNTVFPSHHEKDSNIFSACSSGNISRVKLLVSRGVKPTSANRTQRGLSTIVLAARHRHFHVCEYLVTQGCRVYEALQKSDPALTALGEAIRLCDLDFFHKLVGLTTKEETHAFIQGPQLKSHIAEAIVSGTQEIMEELRSWETTRQQRLRSSDIFRSAVATRGINRSGTDLYELFYADLEAGVRLEILYSSDARGHNLLHDACSINNETAVAFFLRHMYKAHLNQKNNREYTPLVYAMRYHYWKAARLLMKSDKRIVIAAVNSGGMNVLHILCDSIRRVDDVVELIDSVLAKAPDLVNLQSSSGATPLHLAVDMGFAERVSKLLESGLCDLSLKNSNGDTVLDLANKSTGVDKEEILTLLHLARSKR
ncbi:putative NACHT domain-containing protein [Seiridium cardinale]